MRLANKTSLTNGASLRLNRIEDKINSRTFYGLAGLRLSELFAINYGRSTTNLRVFQAVVLLFLCLRMKLLFDTFIQAKTLPLLVTLPRAFLKMILQQKVQVCLKPGWLLSIIVYNKKQLSLCCRTVRRLHRRRISC